MTDDGLCDPLQSLKSDPDLHWAPIRHHSPHCAHQLRRLMDERAFDVVLIEGPADANHLIEHLQAADARPPLALYMFWVSKSDSEASPDRYRCFAPFAAMSPEFVALREARKHDIPARFIDLPYARQMSIRPDSDESPKASDPLYATDTHLASADPMAHLVQSAQCRDFNEWWDRHFEAMDPSQSAPEYFDNMHRFCLLIRDHAPADSVTEARERHMAEHIRSYRNQGLSCLVVTGGYHCPGIQNQLDGLAEDHPAPETIEGDVHLVPYSLDRLDRANGYAAGIPDCGYYDAVWQAMQSSPSSANSEVLRDLSLKLSDALRKAGFPATIPDAIEVNTLAQRLAGLRDTAPGRPELRDAIETCFRKTGRSMEEDPFDDIVERCLRGDTTGSLPRSVPISPLVRDFREQCRRFSLPYKALAPVEKALSLYRSQRHREISQLLHQLAFLGVPYAVLVAGPRFAEQQDLDRVREVWMLEWRAETDALLTECSHLGGRVSEASSRMAMQQMRQARGAQHVTLLVQCLSMGLHDLLDPIKDAVYHWLRRETDAVILCRALSQLMVIDIAHSALGSADVSDYGHLLRALFERCCVRLPWLGDLAEEAAAELTDGLANLHSIVIRETSWADPDLYYEALGELIADNCAPGTWGVAVASLLIGGRMNAQDAADEFRKAFGYAQLSPSSVGEFVQGFLRLGRATFIQSPSLVDLISDQMSRWDEHEFLAALPALRLAFAQLSPRDLRDLAQSIASPENAAMLYARSGSWSEEALMMSIRLRQQVDDYAQHWELSL